MTEKALSPVPTVHALDSGGTWRRSSLPSDRSGAMSQLVWTFPWPPAKGGISRAERVPGNSWLEPEERFKPAFRHPTQIVLKQHRFAPDLCQT